MRTPLLLCPSTDANFIEVARAQVEEMRSGRKGLAEARCAILEVCGFHGPIDSDDVNLMLSASVSLIRAALDWNQGQSEVLLDRWPAQQIINVHDYDGVADLKGPWRKLGGGVFEGRLIALKTDPIWEKVSPIGLPYPPFDIRTRCSTHVEDVDREEAEALGILEFDQQLTPKLRDIEADFGRAEKLTMGKTNIDF